MRHVFAAEIVTDHVASRVGCLPAADELIGKRLHEFLNIAGRIFYETHFAPLLRMQGFFDEVALDLVSVQADIDPLAGDAVDDRERALRIGGADGGHERTECDRSQRGPGS